MAAGGPKERCPCGTGRSYASCCEPLHRGEREAGDAEALMRSRYAAFAKREPEYLWKTLHPDHDDRALDRDQVLRSIRATASSLKYMGLEILDRREPGDDGIAQVLFAARVFEKGRELSFVELSDFAHDGEGWRYLRGTGMPLKRLGREPAGLTIERFEKLATSQ
jgi:SEC-C motif-containing protein